MTQSGKRNDKDEPDNANRAICGLIMPISATASTRTAEHWAKVQKLLHRVIDQAGFEPVNVWVNSSTDRVSERIIGNIFSFPIIVADISDLNPNVMLELGMRLASKKPTIVIVNTGGNIPFDIRDFHALQYPPEMSMLEMEEFFVSLEASLKEKYAALQAGEYVPFLGSIVVDVLSPEERIVGVNEIMLERLSDKERKISNLTSSGIKARSKISTSHLARTVSSISGKSGVVLGTIPEEKISLLQKSCARVGAKVDILGVSEGEIYFSVAVDVPDGSSHAFDEIKERFRGMFKDLDGELGIVEHIYKGLTS